MHDIICQLPVTVMGSVMKVPVDKHWQGLQDYLIRHCGLAQRPPSGTAEAMGWATGPGDPVPQTQEAVRGLILETVFSVLNQELLIIQVNFLCL